jgi:hypothetical protein
MGAQTFFTPEEKLKKWSSRTNFTHRGDLTNLGL